VKARRHCSISPAALLGVFAALAAATLAIGVGFALLGAWLILPFAGLEVVGLGVAFVACARRVGQELETGTRVDAAGSSRELRI
jgi:uncharacterized membrane protein